MKALTRGIYLAALLGMSACGAGNAASVVRPDAPSGRDALGVKRECPKPGKSVRALVIDWDSHHRMDLKLAMKNGVAAVRYDCDSFEVLTECRLEGRYEFAGVSRKEEAVQFTNRDELGANLPLYAAKFAAEVRGESSIDLAFVLIGRQSSSFRKAARDELTGACDGATHFVRSASLGAFSMATGSKGEMRAVTEIFGAGAQAASSSSRKSLAKDGDLGACKASTPTATSPPAECQAAVRLLLVPLIAKLGSTSKPGGSPKPPALPTSCPQGSHLSDGKCTQSKEHAFVCSPDDEATCDSQCASGNADSCYHLGLLRLDLTPAGLSGPREQPKAREAFTRACDGGSAEGCFELARLTRTMSARALIGVKVAAYRKADELDAKACAGGHGDACGERARNRLPGRILPPDAAAAVGFARRGCALGSGLACYLLSQAYLRGGGVTKNPKKAYDILARACHGDDEFSCVEVAKEMRLGRHITKDAGRAFAATRRACALSKMSCDTIGFQLERDNKQAAIAHYTDACKKMGHQPSCKSLKKLQ